jgi:cytosine/uracil/thiamine/allantoin permease
MYDIINKGRVHNVSVSCHLDLFDKIIIPMLTNLSFEKNHDWICLCLLLSSISHNIHQNNLTPTAILQETLPKIMYRRH